MFVPHSQPTASQRRWFGGSLAAGLAVFGWLAWFRLGRPGIGAAALAIALIVLVSYYALPALQRPLIAIIRRLTDPLTLVLSVILLALVFFAVIMPIGLARKLMGRDAIAKGFDRSLPTYWQPSSAKTALWQYFRMY